MPENEPQQGDEKLLILPLGEESKKITQVISNDTARQIIELLADAPLSASDIAQRLSTPLTTIVYNLENLEKVGLIKVEKIKYSEKGREVKVYAPVRKLIVVVPEKTDTKSVTDLLRKYVGVILAAVFASSLIEFFMRSAGRSRTMFGIAEKSMDSQSFTANITSATVVNESAKSGEVLGAAPVPTIIPSATSVPASAATPFAPEPTVPAHVVAPSPLPPEVASTGAQDILANITDTITAHPGLVFLLGCLFVIILFAVMDYRRKRNNG